MCIRDSLGIGVDIIENNRIKKSIQNNKFKTRVYSSNELKLSKNVKNKVAYFSKRFAAKEAFSKALGTGFSENLNFKDIEIVSDKKGNVEQWSYNNDESSPEIKFERKLRFSSLVEGIVADESKGKVYIGQERKGIWEINVFPTTDEERKLIFKKNKFFKPDFEGLALRDDGDSKGYLISSVQGSNGYLLIDRESLKAKTFFRVISGETIDGTTETDGIDVTSISTKKFPKGFFIAQDDDNDGLNQNFKLVDWRKIINEN